MRVIMAQSQRNSPESVQLTKPRGTQAHSTDKGAKL
jgi:hypothetical protein